MNPDLESPCTHPCAWWGMSLLPKNWVGGRTVLRDRDRAINRLPYICWRILHLFTCHAIQVFSLTSPKWHCYGKNEAALTKLWSDLFWVTIWRLSLAIPTTENTQWQRASLELQAKEVKNYPGFAISRNICCTNFICFLWPKCSIFSCKNVGFSQALKNQNLSLHIFVDFATGNSSNLVPEVGNFDGKMR